MMNSMCERVLPYLVFYGLCTYISFVVDSVCSCGEINALGLCRGANHVWHKYEPFCHLCSYVWFCLKTSGLSKDILCHVLLY